MQDDRTLGIGADAVSAYAVKKKGRGIARRSAKEAKNCMAEDSKTSKESTEDDGETKEQAILATKNISKLVHVASMAEGMGSAHCVMPHESVSKYF